MRRPTWLISSLVLIAAVAAGAALAQEPAAKGKIRVLVTTGGHAFEAEPFYAMFDAMPDVQYTKAELPKDAGLLKPGLEKQYDCIVMYDMSRGITPEQQQAFKKLLETGIGVVSLHHNLGAYSGWDEFRKIIGGKFCLEDQVIDGKPYKQTPWAHGGHLKVHVTEAGKKHPITQGIKDFEIDDETYGIFYTAPGIRVLLTTDNPKNNPDIAWTTRYGKSRVFYLMLGHDKLAYQNPNYRKLVHQGIRWVAGK
jgi:type 1 glutamine amidotransferase